MSRLLSWAGERRWLPWSLLALSLIVNVSLASYVVGRLTAPTGRSSEQFVRHLQRNLEIEEKQAAAFVDMMRRARQRFREPSEEMRAARRALNQAILADKPDPAAIDKAFADASSQRGIAGRAMVDEMVAFSQQLTGEQRARLRAWVERRGSWMAR